MALLSPAVRERIFQRDQYVCVHCGSWIGNWDRRMLTLDHVITQAAAKRAGEKPDNRPCNLVLACLPCNSARKDRPLEQLSLTVQARIARRIATTLPERSK